MNLKPRKSSSKLWNEAANVHYVCQLITLWVYAWAEAEIGTFRIGLSWRSSDAKFTSRRPELEVCKIASPDDSSRRDVIGRMTYFCLETDRYHPSTSQSIFDNTVLTTTMF